MGYLSPSILGPMGVQPETVDFYGVNSTTATTFPIGTVMHFDLSQANASTTKINPGVGSVWANMRALSTTNAYQRWAPVAVYIGDSHGAEVDLTPGMIGKFRLNGIVKARCVNTNATLPGDSGSGVPVTWSKIANSLGAMNALTADFTDGELVHGWTLQSVIGVDSDLTLPAVSSLLRYTLYLQGEGVATWYTP